MRGARPGKGKLFRLAMVTLVTAVLAAGVDPLVWPPFTVPTSGRLYVSIGDSYAAGYQPPGVTTTNGFANQVAERAGLRLVNFGCSGATSTTMLTAPGCSAASVAVGAPDYSGTSQARAAIAFVRRHRADVALVTVVIGGNDVKACLFNQDLTLRRDAFRCVSDAIATLRANLTSFLADIRAAAGPQVRVVGLTYPDFYLGLWFVAAPEARAVAVGSVSLFRDVLNPTLRDRYTAAGATFLDVTAATGGYTPLVDPGPGGGPPYAVQQACALTFFCTDGGDPHPTTEGYRVIADQILATMRP